MKKTLFRILGGLIALLVFVVVYIELNTPPLILANPPAVDQSREAKVLSSFFGRDNDLPLTAFLLSYHAPWNDGMPIVFSQEVDPETLDPEDFEVTTQSGRKLNPSDVTYNPANEAFELRTLLMVGEIGDYPEDPPIILKIIGDLYSRSGQNYKGQSVAVTPLPEGPFVSYAEYFTFTDEYPYVAEGRGCDCPKEETIQVVRLVWAGGVRATNGEELGDAELAAHMVTLVQGNDTIQVNPFKLADLADNDNNIDLCLNTSGIPILVSVKAGIAIDPNDEVNDFTEVKVKSLW